MGFGFVYIIVFIFYGDVNEWGKSICLVFNFFSLRCL